MMTEQATLRTQLQRLQSLTPEQLLFLPSSGTAGTPKPAGASSSSTDGSSLGQDLYSIYVQRTQDLVQLQSRIKERSAVWKPKHPKMKLLLEQEQELKDALTSLLDQHTKNVAQQKHSMEVALEVLQKNIAEQNTKLADASKKDTEFNTLKSDVERREKEIEAMRANLQALTPGIAKNDIFVKLGPPTPALEVPKEIPKHLLIGLIGGLVLGGAILMFRDRADDRLSSSSEMMERFNEPILGQIPDVMASRDSNGLPLLQPDDERYSFAEAFRSLRSSLIFMPNQQQLQTLLVTSAIPNEGKSTITANLGITMAAAGANIILVDADLRRGDLASLFDADGRTGLSNVLRGEVTWRDAIQQTKYNGLTLLPRGPVTNQSSELLLLPSLETLLDDLRGEYDLVLFNTAPILATDDTSSLAPHFDGSLMTIRAQFTSARLTHNALNALYQRQVNVLGLILNCVDTQMPDYYYYQYPKYYAAQ
jgi:capsular exopolysaccharide synthesis family protein